jgi:hypothetical protein
MHQRESRNKQNKSEEQENCVRILLESHIISLLERISGGGGRVDSLFNRLKENNGIESAALDVAINIAA